MRTSFHEELERLESELQAESDLVLRSLRASLAALEHGDRELAEEVIRFDDEVDASYVAIEPEVVLFDEPCSALDPISTSAIEDLMHELKREYTLVIVTHNMQQAARVAEMTAFFSLEVRDDGSRHGILVEYDSTERIFTQPTDERTEGYVTGRFG